MEKFQKAPFEEIAAHCESKVRNKTTREDKNSEVVLKKDELRLNLVFLQANMLHDRLAQIFELTIRWVVILLLWTRFFFNNHRKTNVKLLRHRPPPAGLHPARPEWFPSQRVTLSTSPSPCTRWSFQTCVSTDHTHTHTAAIAETQNAKFKDAEKEQHEYNLLSSTKTSGKLPQTKSSLIWCKRKIHWFKNKKSFLITLQM